MAFINSSILPRIGLSYGTNVLCCRPSNTQLTIGAPFDVQAAKHPQFKGAKKANRRRPKKHRPSDINRRPPPYAVDPLRVEGLPEIYEIIPKSQIVEFDEDNTADSTEPVIVGSEAKLEPIESTKSENVTMPVESKEAADKPSAGTEGPAKPEEAVDAVNEPKEVVAAAETEV